jgi:hypothetical protein
MSPGQETDGCLSELLVKGLRNIHWFPSYGWQRLTRRPPLAGPIHLMIALADHFEPSFLPDDPDGFAVRQEQEQRLERWCREYPRMADTWRDADGYPFRHTYFSPAEQYDKDLIGRLVEHCGAGWGEIEIHLHHGIRTPDTAVNTRRVLLDLRNALAEMGCLSRWNGEGEPRYAFVHGNWALANSAQGRFCGVDEEMQILAETGCYADFTLPSAPNNAQVAKINSLYECALPLSRRAPHRRGKDLRAGCPPTRFPLIIQGPLALTFTVRKTQRYLPSIENGELTTVNPPSLERLRLWHESRITVAGRPDWVFIKLHCHGMDPRNEPVMLGEPMQGFLRELTTEARASKHTVHFVTAREMTNIILAACDGREGNPGEYRDYRLRLRGA